MYFFLRITIKVPIGISIQPGRKAKFMADVTYLKLQIQKEKRTFLTKVDYRQQCQYIGL